MADIHVNAPSGGTIGSLGSGYQWPRAPRLSRHDRRVSAVVAGTAKDSPGLPVCKFVDISVCNVVK